MIILPLTIYYIRNSKIKQSTFYEKKKGYSKDCYLIWQSQKDKEEKSYSYNRILETNCFFDIQEAILENVKQIQGKIKDYENKLNKLKKNLADHTVIVEMPF